MVKYRELAEKEDNSSVNEWDEVEHDAIRLIAIKQENEITYKVKHKGVIKVIK